MAESKVMIKFLADDSDLLDAFKKAKDYSNSVTFETALKDTKDMKSQMSNMWNNTKSAYQAYQSVLKRGNSEERKTANEKWQKIKQTFDEQWNNNKKIRDAEEAEHKREIARNRELEKLAERRKKIQEYQTTFRQQGAGALMKSMISRLAPNALFNEAFNRTSKLRDEKVTEVKDFDEKLNDLKERGLEDSAPYKELKAKRDAAQTEANTYSSRAKKIGMVQAAWNTMIGTVKKVGQIGNQVFQAMGIDIKSVFSDVMKNIKEALSETGIASYNMGTSLFTNASARETQMKYGLSGQNAYAFTQAKSMLGMNTDEDLMYMNERQKEAFNSIMDKYKSWYENLESTGALEKMQEAQLEFKMLKQELSMKLLNWFAEHKEEIFNALEVTMNVITTIADIILKILNLFPGGKKYSSDSAKSSDAFSANTTNKTSNFNINVNNTNNANATLQSKADLDAWSNKNEENLFKLIASNLTAQ